MAWHDDILIIEILRKYYEQSFNPMNSVVQGVMREGNRRKWWPALADTPEKKTDYEWNHARSVYFKERVELYIGSAHLKDWIHASWQFREMLAMLWPDTYSDKALRSTSVFQTSPALADTPMMFQRNLLDFLAGGGVCKALMEQLVNHAPFLLPDEKKAIVWDKYAFSHDHYNWHLLTRDYLGRNNDTELTLPYYGDEENDYDGYEY